MDLFEKLKRQNTKSYKNQTAQSLFFMFSEDEFGVYIESVDKTRKPIEANYRFYSRYIREVLRALENIRERNAFAIDWEKDSENIYLAEHDYLLWQLRHCPNLIDEKGNMITFQEGESKISLQIIQKEDETFEGKTLLQHKGQTQKTIKPITENYFLSNKSIYQTQAIGNNFRQLELFDTTFSAANLDKYLTLLFSFFQNIEIDFEDYKVQEIDKVIEPIKSVFFEKIDEENALYLRALRVLNDFEPNFLEQYEVDKIALVSEVEKTINIRPIRHQQGDPVAEVSSLIQDQSKRKVHFYQEDNLLVLPEEVAKDFIKMTLPQLLSSFQIFGAEKLKSYKISTTRPKLNFNFSSGIDFLEGDASLEFEGEVISLFDAIRQYNQRKYIKLSDGTQAIVEGKYIKRLERLFKKDKNGQAKVSFFDLPLVEDLIEDKVGQESFTKTKEVFEGFNKLQKAKYKQPKSVNATLRSYQKQGYKWLKYLHQQNLGGCLADDMGLGKTLQTITLLSDIYPKEKMSSLLVMPRTLLFNWEAEIEKFNPKLTAYTYYAQNRDLKKAKKHNLIFTTYATLRNDIEQFKEEEFYYVILDESQNIKNVISQTNKAVMLLNAQHRLALSGTPIENNLTELYALFRFLNPSMFGSVDDFNSNYATPIQQNNDKEVAFELRKKIYPFVLRRLKKDVLKDLPPKVEQTLYAEMNTEQAKLYEKRRKYYQEAIKEQIGINGIQNAQFFILQALTELRQIASVPEAKSEGKITSAKREVLMEQVFDAVSNGHKCLIFVNFLQAIENVAEDLQKAGIDFVSMTGATRKRQELVERFQNEKQCKVFVMTLKTGGVGLNLVAADMVYIYDPWWNTAAESQATDRTYRIGQDKTVFSYKLITKGSIEEKILQLQEQKKALFDSVISSDSASIKSLSEKDIEFILK